MGSGPSAQESSPRPQSVPQGQQPLVGWWLLSLSQSGATIETSAGGVGIALIYFTLVLISNLFFHLIFFFGSELRSLGSEIKSLIGVSKVGLQLVFRHLAAPCSHGYLLFNSNK